MQVEMEGNNSRMNSIFHELWSRYQTQDWNALYSLLDSLYRATGSSVFFEDPALQNITLLILNYAIQKDFKDIIVIILRVHHRTLVLGANSVSNVQFEL